MLVDGHDVEVVRETLSKDISMTTQRHEFGASIFKALADGLNPRVIDGILKSYLAESKRANRNHSTSHD